MYDKTRKIITSLFFSPTDGCHSVVCLSTRISQCVTRNYCSVSICPPWIEKKHASSCIWLVSSVHSPLPHNLGLKSLFQNPPNEHLAAQTWIIGLLSYRKLRVLVQNRATSANKLGQHSPLIFLLKTRHFPLEKSMNLDWGFFTACFIHALGVLVSAGPSKLSSTQNSTLTSWKTARGTFVFLLLWSGWKITCSSLRTGAYQHLRRSLLHHSQRKCLADCGFIVITSTTR